MFSHNIYILPKKHIDETYVYASKVNGNIYELNNEDG